MFKGTLSAEVCDKSVALFDVPSACKSSLRQSKVVLCENLPELEDEDCSMDHKIYPPLFFSESSSNCVYFD